MLTNWIQTGGQIGSGVMLRKFDGSYPQLFYRSALYPVMPPDPWGFEHDMFQYNAGSAKWDALVVDVHTDPPAPEVGDPGSVLHEAVGNVDLLVLAVDNGPDRMVYGGPVLSHYEFELIGPPRRMSDSEWQGAGSAWPTNQWPAPPAWTAEYLVPGALQPGGWP